jgi:hypothetical protein
LRSHPTRAQLERVRRDYPTRGLMLYLKRGAALAREMKWLGSYRYAVVNMGGGSIDDLQQRFPRPAAQPLPRRPTLSS